MARHHGSSGSHGSGHSGSSGSGDKDSKRDDKGNDKRGNSRRNDRGSGSSSSGSNDRYSGGRGLKTDLSAVDSMAKKMGNLGSKLDDVGSKVGSAHPGNSAFGVVGQSLGGRLGTVLSSAQQHIGQVANGARGADQKLRKVGSSMRHNEDTNAKLMKDIGDSLKGSPGKGSGQSSRSVPSGSGSGSGSGGGGRKRKDPPGGSGSGSGGGSNKKPKNNNPPTWNNPTQDGLYPHSQNVPYAGIHKDSKQHSKQFHQESEHVVPSNVTGRPPDGQPAISIPYDAHRGRPGERLGGVSSTGSGDTARQWRDQMRGPWNDPARRHEAVRMGVIDNLNANIESAPGLHTVIEEHFRQGNLTRQQANELQNEVADTYYRRTGRRNR
ncbi:hypothetical protein [Sciscionella sediminilitoris]|uniref:hypothetical protein n=1 Tax=Sciscionella sediminilitoris TaxID=1445613 RepID=UPI0012E1AA66|nr:hypothetical protein [Sciscionella sp. SE31]